MALDRKNILDALKSLFEGDPTLMTMLRSVSTKEVDYHDAGINVDTKYRLYMMGSPREKVSDRSQNADYLIRVDYTITANTSNPQTGKDMIDDIESRMDWLVSNEMWTGNNLTSDSTSLVYDLSWIDSDCDIRDEEKGLVIISEGVIEATINRTRS